MTALRSGVHGSIACAACSFDIMPGEPVTWTGDGYVHGDCSAATAVHESTQHGYTSLETPWSPLHRPVCPTCREELPATMVCGVCP